MFGGKSPPSLIIATGAEMAANYGGSSPHVGGSFSPSSTASSSSSSSPCPSTPSSSSTHIFSIHNNHFQPHQRIGDAIPPSRASGWNGERKGQMQQRKGRNWQQMMHPNFFFPPPPRGPFSHPPPFPPPMFFPHPPPFMNGPPPPFFPPPPYTANGLPVDTSIPPPPYSMAPPPFFMGFPPPPPPPMGNFNRNGGAGRQQSQSPNQQQQKHDSRPASREGAGSLASTEISYGEHSQEGSYEATPEEEDFDLCAPPPEVNQGKRSFLIHFRPKSKRDEPGCTPPPIGNKEFETFTSILTKGNKSVKETEIMDRFIVEYMKMEM